MTVLTPPIRRLLRRGDDVRAPLAVPATETTAEPAQSPDDPAIAVDIAGDLRTTVGGAIAPTSFGIWLRTGRANR